MDLAPLTTAQNIARHAKSPEQHEDAAQQYAVAAKGVEDSEALRVLSLLEQHHRQLAQIVKSQATQPPQPALSDSASTKTSDQSPHASTDPPTPLSSPTPRVPSPNSTRRPSSPVTQRRPLTTTIASDLATARGIPTNQQPGTRQQSPRASVKRLDSRAAVRQTGTATSQNLQAEPPYPGDAAKKSQGTAERAVQNTAKPRDNPSSLGAGIDQSYSPSVKDEAFQKFYSTFEGLISKLSAPLAFAGLPLNPDEATTTGVDKDTSATHVKASDGPLDGPDITKLISKPALVAVKEDNPGFGGMQESYLVVPTAGGTVSYAGILSRQERHARQHSMEQPLDAATDTQEHFVDAQSSPRPSSPQESRKGNGVQGRMTKKTMEELEMENDSLKQLTDNLSRRLYMWEKSAQSQTMAMQQSIRTLQPHSSTLEDTGTKRSEDGRPAGLEEQLAAAREEMRKYERENEKLKTVVSRYRERWEKLKEGARVRREGTDKGGPEGATSDAR